MFDFIIQSARKLKPNDQKLEPLRKSCWLGIWALTFYSNYWKWFSSILWSNLPKSEAKWAKAWTFCEILLIEKLGFVFSGQIRRDILAEKTGRKHACKFWIWLLNWTLSSLKLTARLVQLIFSNYSVIDTVLLKLNKLEYSKKRILLKRVNHTTSTMWYTLKAPLLCLYKFPLL